ncbi:MAG: MFS transporter [Pseudomonadota bacterium]
MRFLYLIDMMPKTNAISLSSVLEEAPAVLITTSAQFSEQTNVRNASASNQKTLFKYWRIRIMYSMMFGYAAFYLVRANMTIAMPLIQSELGYSKTQLGAVASAGAIFYGLGKCLSGYLGDRVNARYMMSFGLLMSACMSFCMGFGSNLTWFMVFWVLNMCFQSMGWPPCARLLNHWYSPRELARKWALWNSSQQIGSCIVLGSAGYIIAQYGWRYMFFIPAVLCIILAIFLFNRLRDTPESLGLPSIEEHHGLVSNQNEEEEKLSYREILMTRVLNNKLVWYVCIANFFVYVVRMTVFTWAPTFLSEFKGSTIQLAGWQTAAFDGAGIVGGYLAGYLSDKVFKGHRGRVAAILMFLLMGCVFALGKSPAGETGMHFLIMTCVGFLLSGPQILVGVAASDFASKRAAGTASGLTGTFGYIGTAVAGVGIGAIADNFGWDWAFIMITASALLGAFFFALTWNHRSKVLENSSEKAVVE